MLHCRSRSRESRRAEIQHTSLPHHTLKVRLTGLSRLSLSSAIYGVFAKCSKLMQCELYWYRINFEMQNLREKYNIGPADGGKASTALRKLYERGSCKEDPSDTCIEVLRSAAKCKCKMRVAERVRRMDMLGKLTYAFPRGVTNVKSGFLTGIQTEYQETRHFSSFFWQTGKEFIRQLSLTCRALSLRLVILSFRALLI